MIGAGASFDFGLPTGGGLISEIVGYCQSAFAERMPLPDADQIFLQTSVTAMRDTVLADRPIRERNEILHDGLARISRSLWLVTRNRSSVHCFQAEAFDGG